MSGRLFIIATPVGNLGDLTSRARETLTQCDLILAEDTRVTAKLLKHLGLKKRVLSCHNFNEIKRLSLFSDLKSADLNFVLVCDAGTPLVSDPGFHIVSEAIRKGIPVIPIPGPSAFLLALIASGLPCDRFIFEGFLPAHKSARHKRLTELANETRTLIFYVAPHDLLATLKEMLATLQERSVCLARELTKLHEEFLRGKISELIELIAGKGVRGECVLVVEGRKLEKVNLVSKEEVIAQLTECLAKGQALNFAARNISARVGWSKSEVYKLGLTLRKRS